MYVCGDYIMFEQAFKNIDDVLWKEAGCTTELDYTEQTSWLLFLKYLNDLEEDRADVAALESKRYSYILDKPSGDGPVGVFVAAQLKGIKLLLSPTHSYFVLGEPQPLAMMRGFVIALIVVLICGFYLRNIWVAVVTTMAAGLFAQVIGAIEYKCARFVRKVVSG